MLPLESIFDTKCLFMVLNRKIMWVVRPLCAPDGNLSENTPVLVWLIAE